MDEKGLKKAIGVLRSDKGRLVTVQNAEWYSLFREEIRNSIAIEGVFANRQELIDVLEHNNRTNKAKAAAILGYFDAATSIYEYAYNQWQEGEFCLRMADIKQIHTMLMRYEKEMVTYIGELGDFRKITVEVTQSKFKPIDHFYVREAVDLMTRWVNRNLKRSSYTPLTVAALAHTWFESIHPFRDGNGRSGRILLNYILIGSGYLNIAIKGFSKADRDRYYDALEQGDDCFEEISRKLEKGKKLSLDQAGAIITDVPLGELKKIILDQMTESLKRFKSSGITNLDKDAVLPLRDVARLYDYSQDYLRNLINRGELKAQKKGKLWYVKVRDMAEHVSSLDRNAG
ncbi:MAG: Fic family protein [Candidatus Omnitrophica bacterium]|nr:Fic family protein [Candidatus Omnitrophota bacterium]